MRRAGIKLKLGARERRRRMKVMVLGATGFIGPAVLRRLAALGHEPLGVSRGASADFVADRNDPAAIARLVAERHADAVVDLLAMSAEATRPLLHALSSRIGRYVLASSGDVYRQYGALNRREPGGTPLDRLAEDAPLRSRLYPYRAESPRPAGDPQAWMNAYDKIPIEQAVAELMGAAGTVVRLPMVYGPGDRQRRFAWAIGPMLAGRSPFALDPRWGAWRSSYGYVEDVAHALALAAVHPAAGGVIYNAGPLEALDHDAWARRIASATGWRGEFVEAHTQGVDALDLSYPMVLDSRRIRNELGYVEPTGADEALAHTIADEISRAAPA